MKAMWGSKGNMSKAGMIQDPMMPGKPSGGAKAGSSGFGMLGGMKKKKGK